jgi:hypothetical protein
MVGKVSPRLLIPAAVAAGISLFVAAAWWMAQSDPDERPVVSTAPAAPPAPAARSTPEFSPASPAVPQPELPPVPDQPAPMLPWEKQIEQALRTNSTEQQTAQALINLLPTFPEEGRVEAAQHISNLIEDKDYQKVLPLFKNAALGEPALSVFMTDIMNRSDEVKLPALLEIAKMPNHPFREEAQSDLQIFLDHDYGNDWSKWGAAVQQYLAKPATEMPQEPVTE